MLTRRDLLIGTIACGALMRTRTMFAKASQPVTPVIFDVPAGACDCHVHIFTTPAMIAAMKETVESSAVPVVFDHFGGAQADVGPEQPGFAELVALVGSGRAYVKISGAYRASKRAPDYADVAILAKAL